MLYAHELKIIKNMPQSTGRTNYAKWSFLIGIPATIIAAAAAVFVVPNIGCKVGLSSDACQTSQKEAELIILSEIGKPLPNVKIQFIAQGAPEINYTDNNGYAKVSIPSEGDVRVNLSKDGYPVQDFYINLENSQSTVRTIKLSQSGKPEVSKTELDSESTETPPDSISPIETTEATKISDGISFALRGCQNKNEKLICQFSVSNQEEDRSLSIYADYSSRSSRIIDFDGNQYLAKSIDFAGDRKKRSSSQNVVQDIPLKVILTFEPSSSKLDQLALFEISVWTQSQQYFTVQFRDISVSE